MLCVLALGIICDLQIGRLCWLNVFVLRYCGGSVKDKTRQEAPPLCCHPAVRRRCRTDPAGSRGSPSWFLPSCSRGACGVNMCHPGVPTLQQNLLASPGPWFSACWRQPLAPCDLSVPLWAVAPGPPVRSQPQLVLSGIFPQL